MPLSTKTINAGQITRTRGKITRDTLIESALEIFSRDGYDSASTRDIAERAGTNQALINYHFKGKKGLYLAVFEYIAEQVELGMGTVADEIFDEIVQTQLDTQEKKLEFAISSLERITSRSIHMMNSNLTRHWSSMISREQQYPTEAFDIMHNGPMGKLFRLTTHLIAMAKAIEPDSTEARMLSILLFGQIHILKSSRATVLSRMQWKEIGEKEMAISEKQIFLNIRAILKPNS